MYKVLPTTSQLGLLIRHCLNGKSLGCLDNLFGVTHKYLVSSFDTKMLQLLLARLESP